MCYGYVQRPISWKIALRAKVHRWTNCCSVYSIHTAWLGVMQLPAVFVYLYVASCRSERKHAVHYIWRNAYVIVPNIFKLLCMWYRQYSLWTTLSATNTLYIQLNDCTRGDCIKATFFFPTGKKTVTSLALAIFLVLPYFFALLLGSQVSTICSPHVVLT